MLMLRRTGRVAVAAVAAVVGVARLHLFLEGAGLVCSFRFFLLRAVETKMKDDGYLARLVAHLAPFASWPLIQDKVPGSGCLYS